MQYRIYDETRDGAVVIPDDTVVEQADMKMQKFREKVLKKHPTATVVSASKIKCGECKNVLTLSVPYGTRNFDRHVTAKHAPGVPDRLQRSINAFLE